MALSLSCSCGAHFEVEDTFAGQSVSCPECQAPVQALPQRRGPLRTSGYAIASAVLALVLACTGVGTVAAVLLGVLALVSIHRHRGQLAGTGYALFGITAGLTFTGVFLLAIHRGEPFGNERLREHLLGSQVDRTGPLEIVRPQDGFAITRPSQKWGVSRDQPSPLLLINLSRDAFVEVSAEGIGFAQRFATDPIPQVGRGDRQLLGELVEIRDSGLGSTGVQVRQAQPRPRERGLNSAEALLDVRRAGQALTFLVRVLRPGVEKRIFVLRGWAKKRRFADAEPEIRQTMDSFRVLND